MLTAARETASAREGLQEQTVFKGHVSSHATNLPVWSLQGSTKHGTLLFNLYMLPLGKIINSFKIISYHFYADDIRLYIYFCPDSLDKLSVLQNCLVSINKWMADNFLQLNNDKTEMMIFAPDNITPKIKQVMGGLAFSNRSDIRNLGVIFDRAICFNSHVKFVVIHVFFHLRNIEMEMLVHAFISSRLDYCNVLYTCLNKSSLEYKLYRMQLQDFWLVPARGPTLPLCLRTFLGCLLLSECSLKF